MSRFPHVADKALLSRLKWAEQDLISDLGTSRANDSRRMVEAWKEEIEHRLANEPSPELLISLIRDKCETINILKTSIYIGDLEEERPGARSYREIKADLREGIDRLKGERTCLEHLLHDAYDRERAAEREAA